MGQKLVIGPINKGLRNDRTAFVIDNDSFPVLVNAFQWRGRVKRKRGTKFICRLERTIFNTALVTDGAGNFSGNILTLLGLEPNSSVVLNSIVIGGTTFADTTPPTGILTGTPSGSGTINYATGALTITGAPINTPLQFNYYPDLPALGERDFYDRDLGYPSNVSFDTKYAYSISTSDPYTSNSVSFYNNPAISTTIPNYVSKANWTPITWNGANYQQFWTVNYQGALWVTNGVQVPFTGTITNGMQFKKIAKSGGGAGFGIAIITAGNGTTIPAVADLEIQAHGLVQGDFVFINEVNGITGINFQTGYVTSADPQNVNLVRVTFPNAILGGVYTGSGIAQYLTNRSDPTKDVIRWYNGDPTGGTGIPNTNDKGWINFMPPLCQGAFSIGETPAAQYYLVGCKIILPFKDRLLFIGPVIQTSADNAVPIYLQDTVVYSQNGTPYYTASFSAGVNYPLSPVLTPPGYVPILVPKDQTATPSAYFCDQTGFGGFESAGLDQPINTASPNQDVLVMGLSSFQAKFIYTSNDLKPFSFYRINSELGSSSTFSVINMDKGVLTRGARGFVITNQDDTARFDLDIPDQVFEISLRNNGAERITAQRDFQNEWAYFTYVSNNSLDVFPNQSMFYNYRDDSWAIFNECYTSYGQFRPTSGNTWEKINYTTWEEWNETWESGELNIEQPWIIGGNQQGFILRKDINTNEGTSLFIKNISSSTVTCPNHCLNQNDYIIISDCAGTIGSQVNGKVFSINVIDANTFTLNPNVSSGTYLGLGKITRIYVPLIQTKQFPVAWEMARKTRLGPQMYLLSKTSNAQIQLLIFLSQDSSNAWNDSPIVPATGSINNSLVYSTILYTCPESINLGLTPANVNLLQLNQLDSTPNIVNNQSQIWHRVNTSLIGDTVQLGFTLSDAQLRDLDDNGNPISQFEEIEIHSIILDVSPSQILS